VMRPLIGVPFALTVLKTDGAKRPGCKPTVAISTSVTNMAGRSTASIAGSTAIWRSAHSVLARANESTYRLAELRTVVSAASGYTASNPCRDYSICQVQYQRSAVTMSWLSEGLLQFEG
jgi:hypothetical protein